MKSNKQITKPQAANVAKRLAKLEQYRASHQGDLKKAVVQGYYTPLTTGTVYYLSGTATGDTFDDRAGLVINVQRYFLKLNFKMTTTCAVRIIVFKDKFNQGSSPAVSGGGILEVADVTSPLDYTNTVVQKRFSVLHDKTYNFSLNGVLSTSDVKDIAIPMRTRYLGSSASSAFAGQNSLWMLIISDTGSAGSVGFNSRILFTDE